MLTRTNNIVICEVARSGAVLPPMSYAAEVSTLKVTITTPTLVHLRPVSMSAKFIAIGPIQMMSF